MTQKKIIRVRTLYLPNDELILSFILSHPDFTIMTKNITSTPTGQMIAYIEYQDDSGDIVDPVISYKRMLRENYGDADSDMIDDGLFDLFAEPEEKEDVEEFIAPEDIKPKKRGRKKKND